MSSKFNPSTRAQRAIAAGVAVVVTLALHGAVIALAGHYDREYLTIAQAQTGSAAIAHPGQGAAGHVGHVGRA